MLELDGLVFIVVLAFWLFCLFDVITTPEAGVRNLPKGLWIVLVIVLFEVGALLWLLAGRPRRTPVNGHPAGSGRSGLGRANIGRPRVTRPAPRATRPVRRPIAPDDDPEFLRQLGRANRERKQADPDAEPPA